MTDVENFAGVASLEYGGISFLVEFDGEVLRYVLGWGYESPSQYKSAKEYSANGWTLYNSYGLLDGFSTIGELMEDLGDEVYLSLEDYRACRAVPLEAVINTARAWAKLPTIAETPEDEIYGNGD